MAVVFMFIAIAVIAAFVVWRLSLHRYSVDKPPPRHQRGRK